MTAVVDTPPSAPGAAGRLLFLGTGTSHGVPMIGCRCAVCTSSDPRDVRTRASAYVTLPDDTRLLIDTTPDLRAQALAHGLDRVDVVLYTHSHADHLLGLDDVRRFNHLQRSRIPCLADPVTAADIRRTFAYIFDHRVPPGGGLPELDLFEAHGPFCIGRYAIVPVPILHGRRIVYGYRFGDLAYLTDCSAIPDASWALLEGVRTLIIDALRYRPHPTHFTVDQALAVVERLRPARALFTHICHDLPHQATSDALPDGVDLAYDGLSVDFALTRQ